MTLNCKIIKHEHIQQYNVGRVEKYEQISKLGFILKFRQLDNWHNNRI